MLAIARALVARPKLLMLDEPSLGLAPQLVRSIFQVIREINREGTTILLVEQNANMALQVAHRAYVIEVGQIRMEGPAAELAAQRRSSQGVSGCALIGDRHVPRAVAIRSRHVRAVAMEEHVAKYHTIEATLFRKSIWKTRWLVVGLAVLLVWRCTGLISEGWLAQFPWWLWFVARRCSANLLAAVSNPGLCMPVPGIRVLPFKRCMIELESPRYL